MSEAQGARGQFKHIERHLREIKTKQLYEIIKSHTAGAVFSAVLVDDFEEVMKRHPKVPLQVQNIHFFSYYGIVQSLGKGLDLLGLKGPVSFFFDSGNIGKTDIFAAWDSFKQHGPVADEVLSGSPVFEDDKEFLPLQAADYYAWVVRKKVARQIVDRKTVMFPWETGEDAPKVLVPTIWYKKNLSEYIDRCVVKRGP